MTSAERRAGYRDRQKREIRARIVDVAHELVRREGFEALTMRRLAALAGCAPMSVYSYFPDKDAILAALAEDAFATLARRIEADPPADPMAALEDALLRYVDFGLANPEHYRIVFTPRAAERSARATDMPSLRNPVLSLLLARLDACVRDARIHGDPAELAGFLWATVHGAIGLATCFPALPFGDGDGFARRVTGMALASLPTGPPDAHGGKAPLD
jgi:AcrR family transcriptional regulator